MKRIGNNLAVELLLENAEDRIYRETTLASVRSGPVRSGPSLFVLSQNAKGTST